RAGEIRGGRIGVGAGGSELLIAPGGDRRRRGCDRDARKGRRADADCERGTDDPITRVSDDVGRSDADAMSTGRQRTPSREPYDRDRSEPVRRRPVAELAEVVVAPAADCRVDEESAVVVVGAGRDRLD